MRIISCEQGTDEWFQARLGCPSGSGFAKLITATGKSSTSADTYINELIAELVIGEQQHITPNEWMIRGTELEPDARAFYEFERDVQVQEVGFCKHDSMECGISPDGLVGDDGGIEIKCPKASTHIKYLRNQQLPTEYKAQVQGALWITGREWWDFLSYHPSLPPFLIRVLPDQKYIEALANEVTFACDIIERETKKIKETL